MDEENLTICPNCLLKYYVTADLCFCGAPLPAVPLLTLFEGCYLLFVPVPVIPMLAFSNRPQKNPEAWEHRSQKSFKVAEKNEARKKNDTGRTVTKSKIVI